MATLNVQDYGAQGDGSTDDTAAINNAIEDASAGDTVYIPATSDYYLVWTDSRAAVDFTGIADDVTITGDGPDSVLKMDNTDDGKNQHVLGAELDGPTISGLVIESITLDGNKAENGNYSTKGFSLYPGGSGHSITVRDIICENCAAAGFATRGASKLKVRRVTSRNNARHGFDFTGSGAANPDIDVQSIKAVDNDGTGIDFHSGNIHVTDVYTDNNLHGTKLGASGGAVDVAVLRNANLRNARENSGFRETMPDGSAPKVSLDNVQVVGAKYDGFRFANNADYDVGEILAVGNAERSGRFNVVVHDNADVNADTIRSHDAVTGEGLVNYSSGSVSINRYVHSGNESPYRDDSGTLSISESVSGPIEWLDVPGPDDVGAYASSSTSTSTSTTDDTAATYTMDFSSYESGTTPSDWTPRYASTTDDWSVEAGADPVGGNQLQFDSTQSARHALSWDQLDSPSDVELLGLFRIKDLSQSVTSGGRLILRGAGAAGTEDSYFVNVRDGAFGVWKYLSGNTTKISEWGTPADGQWYFCRFRANGDQLKARIWAYDADEPSTWDTEVSDPDLSAGWVGVGSYSEFADSWGYLSIGVGGETAPMPSISSADNTAVIQTLSGSVQTS